MLNIIKSINVFRHTTYISVIQIIKLNKAIKLYIEVKKTMFNFGRMKRSRNEKIEY